ncbi:MAG: LysR family transcriptional regulator [Chloroflexi bacterium]|nr:LysR family transcriptional regulator [Chloroflexota bacterium]
MAVAEVLSFTKAAERMRVSQPAISRVIRDLEQSLGVPLFDRSQRRVMLTEPGRVFLRYARALVDTCDDAEAATASVATEVGGRLNLGVGQLWEYIVPQCLGPFHRQYPNVTFALAPGNTYEIIGLLDRGEISLGFVHRDLGRKDLEFLPMCQHDYVVIAPKNHPLGRRSPISPNMLDGVPFVRMSQGISDPSPNPVLEYWQSLGVKPKHVFSMGSIESVKCAVRSGLGLAFISELIVRDDLRRRVLSQVRLDVPPLRRTLYAVRNRSRFCSPTQRAFLTYVKTKVKVVRR